MGQNEYTRWVVHDRHGDAFTALIGERGKQIARNLNIKDAARDVRCLACHVTPALAREIADEPGIHPRALDGVGCEACHGPASVPDHAWLEPHTRKAWEKKNSSMVDLANLQVQAKICVGCHLGAPAENGLPPRDLNHDLMAAGHPRLTFEFTSFRDNMPPHWSKSEAEKKPEFQAKVWAIGQVATASGAVDLLHYRAEQAKKGLAPWPEFAEANCFSCHAGLRVPSWRRTGNTPIRLSRTIPYSDWHTFLLKDLTFAPRQKGSPLEQAIATLEDEMSQPYPPQDKVIAACEKMRDALKTLSAEVAGTKYDREGCRAILARLKADLPNLRHPITWDEAEQATLAIAALAPCAGLEQQLRPALVDLWKNDLHYPQGRESPAEYRLDSALFETRWKKLLAELPQGK